MLKPTGWHVTAHRQFSRDILLLIAFAKANSAFFSRKALPPLPPPVTFLAGELGRKRASVIVMDSSRISFVSLRISSRLAVFLLHLSYLREVSESRGGYYRTISLCVRGMPYFPINSFPRIMPHPKGFCTPLFLYENKRERAKRTKSLPSTKQKPNISYIRQL